MKHVPGPGSYNTLPLASAFKTQSTFAKDARGEVKLYDPAYEREFANKLGPGPGRYDAGLSLQFLQGKAKISFPKVSALSDFAGAEANRAGARAEAWAWRIRERLQCT